ncbi:MAG: C10 family peptidase [Prolixibacteraceae bacterium]|jgi:hypothetical protein|nr:C10 family peptidase [Prolixibacteraceae bacterium]
MRKWIISLVLVFLGIQVAAETITKNEARIVAVNWFNSTGYEEFNLHDIQHVESLINENSTLIYIVSFNPKGWVMVSGTDKVEPILGYSFNSNFNLENQPVQVEEWLNGLKEEIIIAHSEDYIPNVTLKDKWADSKNQINEKIYLKSVNVANVGPLLSSTWDQGTYYNELAPVDPSSYAGNDHVWIGCVATAVAQVMKYWEYPLTGVGSHSYTHPDYGLQSADFGSSIYNWAAMPDHLTAPNTEVQKLSYHVAVSIDMDFDPIGSGAYMIDAQNALINYFKYNTTIFNPLKSDWSNYEWENMIKYELDNNRPVLYAGYNYSNTSGHAFVCDGYSDNFFHFNWGWAGYANGNFRLNLLDPGTGDYSYNQSALLGVEPITPTAIASPFLESFESANSGDFKLVGKTSISNTVAHSGSNSILLSEASFSSYSKNTASISFIAPALGQISFWVKRSTPDTSLFNQQSAVLMPAYGSSELRTFFDGDFTDTDWVNYVADISEYAGQLVRLQFVQENYDVEKEQWMYIDDVVVSGINQNLAPFIPSIPFPVDNEVRVELSPVLKWSGGDPNGNEVSYSVFFGTTPNPPKVTTVYDNEYIPDGLAHSTKYYWKIVSDDGAAQSEGPEWNFTTRNLPPNMALCRIDNITSSSATVCGQIISDNNSTIYKRGICWDEKLNPQLIDNYAYSDFNTNVYSCELTNLKPYTKYYVRSFTETSEGTAFSQNDVFTTLTDIPTVSALSVNNIKRSYATIMGAIPAFNDSSIFSRGVAWSTESGFDPLLATRVKEVGNWNSIDSFEVFVNNLPGPAVIYYRVFAENSVGINYSDENNFITRNSIPSINLDEDNSSDSKTINFKGVVVEQETDGFICDDDVTISDADGDTIQQMKIIVEAQLFNSQEFLMFPENVFNLLVDGNNTDTLIIASIDYISNSDWETILKHVGFWSGSDAPDSEFIREVSVTINDGFDNSNKATSFLAIQPVNDAPVNVLLPKLSVNPLFNDTVTANIGVWADELDETNCDHSFSHQWQILSENEVIDVENATSTELFISEEFCGSKFRIAETVIDSYCGGNNVVNAEVESEWYQIRKAEQTIAIDLIPTQKYSHTPYVLSGVSSSGLPPKFSINSNIAHISNDTLYMDAVGVAVVSCIQEGNSCYNASEKAFRILTINPGEQEILLSSPDTLNFSDKWIPTFAESSAGLPLQVSSSNNSIASFSNDTIFLNGTGDVELTFEQAGNEFISAAKTVKASFYVDKGEQIFTSTITSEYKYGSANVDVEFEFSSNLEPVVEISDTSILKYNNNSLQIIGVGDCIITINQTGNEYYHPFTERRYAVQVLKGDQQIELQTNDQLRFGQGNIDLNVFSTTLLPYQISSSDTLVVKLIDDLWSIVGVGDVKLIATSLGNELWNEASSETTLTILKGIQEISVPDSIFKYYGDEDFTLEVTTNNGLSEFEINCSDDLVSIDASNNISIQDIGKTFLQVTEPGNNNWLVFSAEVVLFINKGIQSISFEPIQPTRYGDEAIQLEAITNSALPISFVSNNTEIVKVEGSKLLVQNAGSTTILAIQSGNDFWSAAANVSHEVVIHKGIQRIETLLDEVLTTSNVITKTDYSASSGLEISEFVSSDPSILNVEKDEFIIHRRGEVEIAISQFGNQNFEAVDSVFRYKIQFPVGIYELEKTTISIYPNPTKQFATISIKGAAEFPLNLKVINALGQIVFSKVVDLPDVSFDVSEYNAGVYFVVIKSDRNYIVEKLLVE